MHVTVLGRYHQKSIIKNQEEFPFPTTTYYYYFTIKLLSPLAFHPLVTSCGVPSINSGQWGLEVLQWPWWQGWWCWRWWPNHAFGELVRTQDQFQFWFSLVHGRLLNVKTCFSCRLRIIIEPLGTQGPIYVMADAHTIDHDSTSFTPIDDQVDGPSSAIDSCTLQPSLSLGSELPPVVLHAVTNYDQSVWLFWWMFKLNQLNPKHPLLEETSQ